jgi:hypothetical protein
MGCTGGSTSFREEKHGQLAEVRRSVSAGSHQNRSERDAFASMYEDRLAQLNAVDDRLVFGRLDLDDGEERYIGRIGLSTEDLQQLMVDWRAPEAGHLLPGDGVRADGRPAPPAPDPSPGATWSPSRTTSSTPAC